MNYNGLGAKLVRVNSDREKLFFMVCFLVLFLWPYSFHFPQMSEDLAKQLASYKAQLQQVEAALSGNGENEDLLKLKKDLQVSKRGHLWLCCLKRIFLCFTNDLLPRICRYPEHSLEGVFLSTYTLLVCTCGYAHRHTWLPGVGLLPQFVYIKMIETLFFVTSILYAHKKF